MIPILHGRIILLGGVKLILLLLLVNHGPSGLCFGLKAALLVLSHIIVSKPLLLLLTVHQQVGVLMELGILTAWAPVRTIVALVRACCGGRKMTVVVLIGMKAMGGICW